ncbi:MAG TPA: leucyl aminopeptidase [Tepidisphaeraceae bacterium]
MIPTSTNATVELATKIPAKVNAVAVLTSKNATPRGHNRLAPGDRAAVNALVAAGAVSGKAGEVVSQVVTAPSSHRVLVIGLSATSAAGTSAIQSLREAGAALAKHARRQKLQSVALVVADAPAMEPADAVEALATGFLLGSFAFREYKGSATRKGDDDKSKPVRLTLIATDTGARAKAALQRARMLAEAQNLARTIASRPGNEINPPSLAKLAQEVARDAGLRVRVLDEKELKRLGMGGLLAVGAGSPNPPRLIALEHKGSGSKLQGSGAKRSSNSQSAIRNRQSSSAPILVIGKSITFDTGGISIKPADKMGDMIYDKCGGMAVLGLMYALAKSDFPMHVVGLLTSAENHVSGTAYRPGDIITLYNGVTVEITNTDAEGRLVLADAIAWGIETYQPAAVVDLATLTGGCVVALGHTMAGLMSNDDPLASELLAAAGAAGEKIWRLPVGDDQRDMLKSNHADIINSAGRWASPLTGAAFLTFALPDKPRVPWAHLDIAGVADTDKELPLYAKGATGFGVRTLYQWLTTRAGR